MKLWLGCVIDNELKTSILKVYWFETRLATREDIEADSGSCRLRSSCSADTRSEENRETAALNFAISESLNPLTFKNDSINSDKLMSELSSKLSLSWTDINFCHEQRVEHLGQTTRTLDGV
jgi:hypothetical protein